MKIDAKKILKTISKSGFYILSRAAGFGAVGVVLNIILLLVLIPEIRTLYNMMAARMTGGGPLGAALMIAFFGVLFPAVYIVLGKKHGVQKALQFVVHDNRDFIMEYIVDRLIAYVKKKTGIDEKVDAALSKSAVLSQIPAFIEKLDTMPRPMRLIMRVLLNRVDLADMLVDIIQEQKIGEEGAVNFDSLVNSAKGKMADALEEKLLAPDLKWFGLLFGTNNVLFLLLKIFL